jgi:hypothetical protein
VLGWLLALAALLSGETSPSVTDVDEVRAIYQKFRSPILRYRGGMPAGFIAAIIKHESGGRQDSRGDPTLGEVGVMQIENSFPDKIRVARDVRNDVDGNIWLGCLEYQIRAVEMHLLFPRLIVLGSEDSWKLARSSFAIGAGGTKTLIQNATQGHPKHRGAVFSAIRNYVNQTGGMELGSQSASKVQSRINNIDAQWKMGVQVAGAFYGAPEKVSAPKGIAYSLPASVAPYLSSPGKQIIVAAGLVVFTVAAVAITARYP